MGKCKINHKNLIKYIKGLLETEIENDQASPVSYSSENKEYWYWPAEWLCVSYDGEVLLDKELWEKLWTKIESVLEEDKDAL